MLNITFLDRASLPVPLRLPRLTHRWIDHAQTLPGQVRTHAADADVIVTNKVVLDADTLAALPRLKLIAVAATGINVVDLAAAHARGITVCNIRGYAESTVPEHALMLMLALMRNLPAYRDAVSAGDWSRSPHFCFFGPPVRDLRGRILTIVGYGSLGAGTARLAAAFGMQVLRAERPDCVEPRPGYTAFHEAVRRADVLSLHCPLNDATRGLINREVLSGMKHDALLINTARGGLVDEVALVDALQSGTLGGAGIDVLATEPPRADSPLLQVRLPNLIVTPHIGWASMEAMQRLADQLIDNIEAWAAGTPVNIC
jgi:glycerate dehydrogenase